MDTITLTKKLTMKKQYDVIVCGGGVAGVAAAVTAAGEGHSVLILEKSNILGGLATLGLINLFVPMCNGRGKQIIFGLCEKWVRLSTEVGFDTIPEEWKNGEPAEPTNVRYIQRFSPDIFALQLTEEIVKSGADILFDCIACEPVMEGKTCKGVITESKSGTEYYGCKMLIDVTGDCDVLRHGGVPVVPGENFFTYMAKMITLESCERAVKEKNIYRAFTGISGGGVNLFGDNQPENVPKWSGLTVEEVTDYLVRNQLLVLKRLKGTDRFAREITHLPFMPQFRTTCRLDGDYALKVSDAYKHFDDSICAINDFEHRDHLFEVPLRCITRKDYPNMLTAGKSASGEGYGWDVLRVIPPAIITGQAAAHTACMALRDKVNAADVNITNLQKKLENDDIMVHFPDEYVPEDKTVVIHGKNAVEIDGGHM
ncbi:MAG: FAD-dependent oxidoreductase [Clostridia bacterium]|nr:FAD-dependent oxidoreductase [Clostridia bacterium]